MATTTETTSITDPIRTMRLAVRAMVREQETKARGMREAIESLAGLRAVAEVGARQIRCAMRLVGAEAR